MRSEVLGVARARIARCRERRSRPAVRGFLESLAGKIDAAAMRKMNAAVDKDKRRPEDVAKEFLASVSQTK